MQKKISDIPGSQFLEVDFPRRKAFEQKTTGHIEIIFRAGWHQAALSQKEALIFLTKKIGITASPGFRWRGHNVGFAEMPK